MPRVHMYDTVKDHEERTAGIWKGYLVGISLIILGAWMNSYGLKELEVFSLLIWIGFIIIIGSFIISRIYKKLYRHS